MGDIIDLNQYRHKKKTPPTAAPHASAGVGIAARVYTPNKTLPWTNALDALNAAINDIKNGAIAPDQVYIGFHQTFEGEEVYPFYSYGGTPADRAEMVGHHAGITESLAEE